MNALSNKANTVAEQTPGFLQQITQSDYFSYVWKVGLAVIAFFVLYMIAKRIASLASKKFYENANITDLNKQEST